MMQDRLFESPLIVLLAGLSAVIMIFPAIYALTLGDISTARAFFFAVLLGSAGIAVVALSITGKAARDGSDLGNLFSLFLAYSILPAFLALPFYEAVGTTSYLNAYIEMVSCITTTGATLFDPARLPDAVHLWRGLVGWMGGLLIWISAAAVLAPLNLGGFEVASAREASTSDAGSFGYFERALPWRRLKECTYYLAPVYIGLTLTLFLCLLAAGDRAFVAAMHAMATLSTSAISPLSGLEVSQSGIIGEVAIFAFLFFALSRQSFSGDMMGANRVPLFRDPEFLFGLAIVGILSTLLFLRHWLSALEVDGDTSFLASIHALWGAGFTVLSFLTTTGFESVYWDTAREWSGLGTTWLILQSVALMGGGVATSAGGIKMLRVFALYLHGRREMQKLLFPSSVSNTTSKYRRLSKHGAFIAWLFLMLFSLTLAAVVFLLTFLGQGFEESMVLAVAGLTTTGPLLMQPIDAAIELTNISGLAKVVFAGAMIIGRLETLAIIALLNPDIWRR